MRSLLRNVFYFDHEDANDLQVGLALFWDLLDMLHELDVVSHFDREHFVSQYSSGDMKRFVSIDDDAI